MMYTKQETLIYVIQNIVKHWFIYHETWAKYCTKKFVYKNVCYAKNNVKY